MKAGRTGQSEGQGNGREGKRPGGTIADHMALQTRNTYIRLHRHVHDQRISRVGLFPSVQRPPPNTTDTSMSLINGGALRTTAAERTCIRRLVRMRAPGRHAVDECQRLVLAPNRLIRHH